MSVKPRLHGPRAAQGSTAELPSVTAQGVKGEWSNLYVADDVPDAAYIEVSDGAGGTVWMKIAGDHPPAPPGGVYTIFLSPTGNDANPGTLALPVRTIGGALARVPVGYTFPVVLQALPGVYDSITAPGGAFAVEYTFAQPAANGGTFPPPCISLVGGFSAVTNANGSQFVTSAPSAAGPNGIGTTLPTGAVLVADEYLGAQLVITACTTASLVGQMVPVGMNDAAGNFRIPIASAPIPAGTTFRLVRPNAEFPYQTRVVLSAGGGVAQVAGVRFRRDNLALTLTVLDVEVTHGVVDFAGCEFDFAQGAGVITGLSTNYDGIAIMAQQAFELIGQTFASLAVDGVTPSLVVAGCYAFAGTFAANARGLFSVPAQSNGKVLIASVFKNLDVTHSLGGFQCESCEGVNSRISLGAFGVTTGDIRTSRLRDAAAGVGTPVILQNNNQIAIATVAVDNFSTVSALSINTGSAVAASTVVGAGAAGSTRGWVLSNVARVSMNTGTTVTGTSGVDLRFSSAAPSSNVDLTYAQLATNVVTNDTTGPQSSGCQVQRS